MGARAHSNQFTPQVIEAVLGYVAMLKGISGQAYALGQQDASGVIIALGNDRLQRFGIEQGDCAPQMIQFRGRKHPLEQLGSALLELNQRMRQSDVRCQLEHWPTPVPPIEEAYLTALDAIAYRFMSEAGP